MQRYFMVVFFSVFLIAGPWQAESEDYDEVDQSTPQKSRVSDAGAERAAKLKARIRAMEKKQEDSARHREQVATPLEHKTVRGSDQIKAKIKAVKESKSRRWLQDWWSEHVTKNAAVNEKTRKRTFKQKLEAERAQRQAKKQAREDRR